MDRTSWNALGSELDANHPLFGNITIELVYHGGKVTHYIINRSERRNLEPQEQQAKSAPVNTKR